MFDYVMFSERENEEEGGEEFYRETLASAREAAEEHDQYLAIVENPDRQRWEFWLMDNTISGRSATAMIIDEVVTTIDTH